MEYQDILWLIFWVVLTNLSLFVLFGRSVRNLIDTWQEARKDGKITEAEEEEIIKAASRLLDQAKSVYIVLLGLWLKIKKK